MKEAELRASQEEEQRKLQVCPPTLTLRRWRPRLQSTGQLSCPSWTEKPRPSPVCLCVQEELEAFEKRQQRGGRRSKRRGRREEVDHPGSASGSWRRCATFVLLPLGGVLLSAAAYYLMSGQ